MEEFITAIGLGILEMTAFILFWSVLAVLWCVGMVLLAAGRLAVGGLRVGYGLASRRRRGRRELALVALEYQEAVRDIQRIGAVTRRRIRALSERRA